MAPNKPNPMEEPPAASSDEEEEESEVDETSSEEEQDEDDEDEKAPEPTQFSSPPRKQPPSKKPELSAAGTLAKSSSSEEECGSKSESDSEPEATPKPRSSKPASKRANEMEGTDKETKRAKQGTDGGEQAASESNKAGEEMKKQLFQRVWSEDDEIAVLKGMIEFSTKKGIDPNQDMNGFYDFIKNSLYVDVSRTQLVDKIRRLRKKFENAIKKGEDRTFSKPHEQKSYELSKKVWRCTGKARTEAERMEVDNEKELSLKIVGVEKFLFDRSFGMAGLKDYVIKNGFNMIGGSKKAELEQRWKRLQIAQLELYIEQRDLVREQVMLVLEALKSSDDK